MQSAAATVPPPAGDFDETLPDDPTGDWTAPTTEGNGLEPESNEDDFQSHEHGEDEWQPPSDDAKTVETGDNDEHPGKQDRIPVSGSSYFSIFHVTYSIFMFHSSLTLPFNICGKLACLWITTLSA